MTGLLSLAGNRIANVALSSFWGKIASTMEGFGFQRVVYLNEVELRPQFKISLDLQISF